MYDPHRKTRDDVTAWFAQRSDRYPGVAAALEAFFSTPGLMTARELMSSYFKHHQQGDIEPLRLVTSAFADKRLVAKIVDSILDDDKALGDIAARSYPHPIGFDKLVLHHDRDSGFKLRLHIYWRGNQRAAMERLHLHKFEMASAIVSGELTNHLWRITSFDNQTGLVKGIDIQSATGKGAEQKTMYAYSGYRRDKEGALHKSFLGACTLERMDSQTHVGGQSYAQSLEDGHYVETNAETGISNGDICSTIYIHGDGLKDGAGRSIPILFEEFRLASDDQVIDVIPPMDKEKLRESLTRYKNILQESISFYDWLYDEKHGRNLSVGMIAGYLLSERYHNPHTLNLWITHERDCKHVLRECSATLANLVRGQMSLSDIPDDDRNKRYYTMLLDKAERHPAGKEEWLESYGDLVKEMWRYCGAIRGEQPEISVLKPVWQAFAGKNLPGGAHYGHVAAMIEAAYKAKDVVLKYYQDGASDVALKAGGEGPASAADREAEEIIHDTLKEYFPAYKFKGEEGGDRAATPPQEGDRRWLTDSIDGTRNFLVHRDDFCISIACQEYRSSAWLTTDGLELLPVSGKVFWAEKDHGAYCIERDDLERKLAVPQLAAVTGATPLDNAIIDLSARGLGLEPEMALFRQLRTENAIFRISGSAAIMLASVCGKGSDGVVITAHDYDIAAGRLIAEEAGAMISETAFTAEGKNRTVLIAARSPEIHDALKGRVTTALSFATRPPGSTPQP